MENILTWTIENNIPIFASEILFTELLTRPYQESNQQLVKIYTKLESSLPSLQFIPISKEIAITSAQLRAKYKIRTPDAIHLATAIVSRANCFICSDEKLTKVSEIQVITI